MALVGLLAVAHLSRFTPVQTDQDHLVEKVERLLLAYGYRGPVRFKSKFLVEMKGRSPEDSSYYQMAFHVGGGGAEVLSHVRPDGTVTWFQQMTPLDDRIRYDGKTPGPAEASKAWSLFSQLGLDDEDWKLDEIKPAPDGWMACFYRLANGLRVVNTNPVSRYEVYFNAIERVGTISGTPDLPPVSEVDPEVSRNQAQEILENYYVGTKKGIFAPEWPNRVFIEPELAYYRMASEDKARLIWLPRIFEILTDGRRVHVGDFGILVDAHTGEIVRATDMCLG